jgi:hypothetical protein
MAILAPPNFPHRDPLSSSASAPRGRVLPIDVVRGLLICLITVGHGQILLNDSGSNRWLAFLISKATNLGTPAFTCISGMLLGYFEQTRSDSRRIRRKYFIRGLQLLTLAHPLIAAGTYPLREEASFGAAYLRYWYITDTLAILFMALPTLLPWLSLRARIALGMIGLISWKLVSLVPAPSSPVLLVLKEFFFGVSPQGVHLLGDTYPILPLAGLFMIGTVLGNAFARSRAEGTLEQFVGHLRGKTALLILLSGCFVGLWIWGKLHSESVWGSYLKMLFYPDKLSSLLPFYLAILFLIFTHVAVKTEIRGRFGRAEQVFSLFGRSSLLTYVAQYFLVQTIPSLIGWRNHLNVIEMIFYLGGTIMILFYLVRIYNNFFFKGWNSASKAKRMPGRIKTEQDVPSPLESPELLDLKKDLW